jgi:glycosyltransferase involved in cell wall biosynthesis
MKIGFAGPVSLQMLAGHVNHGDELPVGYEFPPMALWVEELLRRGHDVTLFSLAPGLATARYFVGPRLRIYVGCYRARHRARDLFRQEREDLRAAMSASDCDVIHAHWTYEFALAALAAGKPTLVTAHDAPGAILRLTRDGYRALRFVMAWMVARRARTLTAVSTYVADHFRRVLHYRGDITVVPNGLPAASFSADHFRRARSPVFTYVTVLSGWGPVKNGELALLAYQQVRQELPATRLVMFGAGYELGGAAHRWAVAHGVAESVEFAGPVKHHALAGRLAAEADVLIHPAKEESFCMAAAEAMALGIPVIAGDDAGGITDVVKDGVGGLLVPLRPCEMARAMRRLATDEGLRNSLSCGARARAGLEYSIANVFDAYEDQYRRICGRPIPTQHD